MNHFSPHAFASFATADLPPPLTTMSPLMLADRLITLAKDADRDGFASTADQLVRLAYAIWDGIAVSNA